MAWCTSFLQTVSGELTRCRLQLNIYPFNRDSTTPEFGSIGFDTEADVALLAHTPEERARIRAVRAGLVAEYLDADADAVAAANKRFNTVGRGWPRPLRPRRAGPLGAWLSRSRFFDPRYLRSVQGRLGLTNCHLFLGLGALGLTGVLLARGTRQRRV